MRDIIKKMNHFLIHENEEWFQWWCEQLSKYESIPDGSHEDKYKRLRVMESAYGGMMSFNDIRIGNETKKFKLMLFNAIQHRLRLSWKAMGNEYHAEQFRIMPIGAKVYMIKGRNGYIDRNGNPNVVDYAERHMYIIYKNDDLDITNMPLYTIRNNNTYRSVRHDVLEYAE